MPMEQKRQLISCKRVNKSFQVPEGTHQVIRDFNLEAQENEFICLFGPGQCGKTTIINLIAGFELPDEGNILVGGELVTEPGPERGVVFQNITLFPWLTVMGNVEYGLKMAGVPKQERREQAQKYIDLVGLQGFENTFPVKLSGGMRQRVEIGRASCRERV